MASLTRGVSIRRQGSSGRSWADSLGLSAVEQPQQRYCGSSNRTGKGDGITKKTISVPDSDLAAPGGGASASAKSMAMNREEQRRKTSSSSSSRGGVFSWLKNRFRKTRS